MKRSLVIACALGSLAAAPLALAKKHNGINSVADLYFAEAHYLDQTDQQYLASIRMQVALETGLMAAGEQQDSAKARTADSQLDWGMHYLPSAIYQQLVDRRKPYRLDDQTWLDLATLQYRRGYWGLTGTVEYSLSRLGKRPKRQLRGQRTLLRSQLYLKQNRFAEADRTLSRYRGSFEEQPFAEFNRAIALLKQNKSEEGAALLDKVGNLRSDDETLLGLRDLANYTLGNWFVNNDQAGTAIPILKKVRGEGPFSNKALLSLGWAYLSSTGKLQRVSEIFSPRCLKNIVAKTSTVINNNTDGCRPARTLRIENIGKDEQKQMQRAMTAWQVVQERNPLYPGVQETLMAMPYALDQLGYTYVAENQYKKAIESLQYEAKRINQALDVIHAGQLLKPYDPSATLDAKDPNWDLGLLNLSQQLDMRLLYRLYSQHEFYEALVNYQQLRQLQTHVAKRISNIQSLQQQNGSAAALSVSRSLKINDTDLAANSRPASATNGARKRLISGINQRGFSTSLSDDTGNSSKQSRLTVWSTHNKTAENSLPDRSTTLLSKAKILYKQLDDLASKHAGYLALQSQVELNVALDRVNTYMAQARLSLARIKDRLAKEKAEGEAPATPRTIEQIDFNPLFKTQPEE